MKKADFKYERMEEGGLLITGTPRSGTKSVTQYFKDHGVDLGHECSGEKGTVDWRHAFTKNLQEERFPLVLTLVRDPLDTVRSLNELITNCGRDTLTWPWIELMAKEGDWEQDLANLSWLSAAVNWWTSVYKNCSKYPMLRMEDLPKLPHLHKNHARVNRVDWSDKLNDYPEFWKIANHYGYYIDACVHLAITGPSDGRCTVCNFKVPNPEDYNDGGG